MVFIADYTFAASSGIHHDALTDNTAGLSELLRPHTRAPIWWAWSLASTTSEQGLECQLSAFSLLLSHQDREVHTTWTSNQKNPSCFQNGCGSSGGLIDACKQSGRGCSRAGTFPAVLSARMVPTQLSSSCGSRATARITVGI